MPREKFSAGTIRVLGQRAAYICSAPKCGRLTIGPGLKDEQIEITGKAAHIYSASKDGPRGQGELTSEQLTAYSNGIWLCAHHADLIDKNTGARYPAQLIKSWKALHEYRIAFEHSGRNAAFGFVRALYVKQSALFEPETKMELGKTTFLIGANNAGKTALCQWLSSVDTLQHLWRWLSPTKLNYTVIFDAPTEHHLSVETGDGSIDIDLDGSTVAFNHHRIAVAFLGTPRRRTYNDDLDRLKDILRLDEVSTRSLATVISPDGIYIRAARFMRERGKDAVWRENLYCTLVDGKEIPFQSMSDGEQGRVILDLAITQMRSVAVFAPALLIVEWPGLRIDSHGFEQYLNYFSSTECTFQTLITLFESKPLIEGLGWQTYQITPRNGVSLGRVQPVVPAGADAR